MRIPRQPSTVQNVTAQKPPHNVEYFIYLGSMMTNDVRCTRGSEYRLWKAKTGFNQEKKKKKLITSKTDLNLRT
jgi:hypothetical protein